MSDHWEARVTDQGLNCLKSSWIKVILAESSHTCVTFISFVSIIRFLTLCTSSSRDLRNMSTHQKFEGNIWNILSCSQSLKTQFSWFSRNTHQFINSCLNFWCERFVSSRLWLSLSCLRRSRWLSLSWWVRVSGGCRNLLLLDFFSFRFFFFFWIWFFLLYHCNDKVVFFDGIICSCLLILI